MIHVKYHCHCLHSCPSDHFNSFTHVSYEALLNNKLQADHYTRKDN